MTSCRVKCLQTLSVELLVAASADPRMKRRCSYALGSFVRCPLCSADASLGCFQPLGPSTSDTRTEKRIPCNLRYMATAILWKQLCVVATWKSMGGTLAQNCPREELELELEPLRSATALRAFEGKAFTVVAFDFTRQNLKSKLSPSPRPGPGSKPSPGSRPQAVRVLN